MKKPTRRELIAFGLACAIAPRAAQAATPLEISWDDLIPPGVPYADIIGEGEMDEANDTWRPIFDENATKLNPALDGAYVRMPGFIIPLETGASGVTEFLLVPYVGACIHTPPPPANQLVLAETQVPWPGDNLWDAVWVVGTMHHELDYTDIGVTGYRMDVEKMTLYEW